MEVLNHITGLHLVIFIRFITIVGVLISFYGLYKVNKEYSNTDISFSKSLLKCIPYFILFKFSFFCCLRTIMLLIWFNWYVLVFYCFMYIISCSFIFYYLKYKYPFNNYEKK